MKKAWVVVAVILAGCEFEPTMPETYPLTGTVVREGKPVPDGGLIFVPEAGGWGGVVVDAAVNPDGTFSAKTARTSSKGVTFKDGIKVGRYKVIYHPKSNGAKTGLEYEFPDLVLVIEKKDNTIALMLPEKMPEGKGMPRDDDKIPEKPYFDDNEKKKPLESKNK